MKFVNLTPHVINETSTDLVIPPSGNVARVATESRQVSDISGIPIFATSHGEVEGLPSTQDGTVFIVSGMVLSVTTGRDDVMAPGELVRDENGKPVGCRGFRRH